ncbi:MAG TPA: transglutaminaseTgpA domain-containing protein, partial [Actinomycetota bacterium]|nr:transglutaminaseTgpA domain-containing protein [Actinomycetota bacterium]
MAITEPRSGETSELQVLEERAAEHLEKGVTLPPDLDEESVDRRPVVDYTVPAGRLGIVVGFSTVAAAMMVGGVFFGVSPRIYATLAGIAGIGAAIWVRRFRNPIVMNVLMALSVFLIGILLNALKGNIGNLLNPGPFIREAITEGDVLRPPVPFTLGWGMIQAWLMAAIGFAAAWIAIELRKPALGMMVPLPIIMFAAISVPDDQKVLSGLACLVLFAIGLGMLSGVELGPEDEQRSLAFELRRAARALPLIAAITLGLFFLSRTNFLFPEPLFDPTQSAQKPKTIPPQDVPDRVLFEVESRITGPWRMGSLDVYDPADGHWKLPPFAENRLEPVPDDGLLDRELQAGISATFRVRGLDGAVLPGLPNMVGIIAQGPFLSYDIRTGNIRLSQGVMQEGIEYTTTAARIPTLDELR